MVHGLPGGAKEFIKKVLKQPQRCIVFTRFIDKLLTNSYKKLYNKIVDIDKFDLLPGETKDYIESLDKSYTNALTEAESEDVKKAVKELIQAKQRK